MAHWETIQDRSSYISQVRLVPPKNHSVERGNGIFEAVSKSSISITTTKSYISHTHHAKNSKSLFKSMPLKLLLLVFVLTTTTSLYWQCSRPGSEINTICSRVNNSLNMQHFWNEDAKASLHQSYVRVTQPLIIKLNNAYHWIDTADAIQRLGNSAEPLMHLPQKIAQEYVKPFWELVTKYTNLWRQQLDDYVEYGNPAVDHPVAEVDSVDTMVEEKIKKTARRILEYIDQLNKDNVKAGMDGELAKRKAQEIIKDIKEEANALKRQKLEALVLDKDDDLLEYEVKSILEVAQWEKDQLQRELVLLQSRLAVEDTGDKDLHLGTALKLEIEYLRANAENKVRERAKEAILHLQEDEATFTTVMKDRIHSTQRDALKNLRQVYRNIYQTNQIIDNLA